MTDTVIKGDTSIYKQLTNVGAWFSSDMTSSSYILIEASLRSPEIITILCFKRENYNKALHILCERFEDYGTVKAVEYNHVLDRFEFKVIDDETQQSYCFYLEAIDKYLEEI